MSYVLNAETLFNVLLVGAGVPVVPDSDKDLAVPGILFLDNTGTEGTVIVDLLNGGTVTLAMTKNTPLLFLVKRVRAGGTAAGILLNPLSQRQ